MAGFQSDALVFLGATEVDPAHQKVFPALQAMVKRGHLNVPVIGVAKPVGTLIDSRREPVISRLRRRGMEDRLLKDGTAVFEGDPNTWRPSEVDQRVAPVEGGGTRLSKVNPK
jgi:hypothetical protein